MADIVTKMTVEGEAEYKKMLSSLNADIKESQAELKAATAAASAHGQSLSSLSQETNAYKKAVEDQKEKVAAIGDQLDKATKAYGANSDQVRQLKTEYANASAELSKTEASAQKVPSPLSKIGEAAKTAGSALKSGFSATVSAGIKTVTTSVAAAAAGMAALGTAAVAGISKLASSVAEVSDTGDKIDKASQAIGFSAEEYQKWGYVLDNNGASVDSMSTWMAKLTNTLDDAGKGSKTANEKFEALGLSVKDLQSMTPEQKFNSVITALQGVSDSSKRAALANDMFGNSSSALAATLNSGADSVADLKDRASELGLVMSNKDVAASASFNDAMTDLKGSFSGLKNSILAEAMPGMTQFMGGLTGLVSGQEDATQALSMGASSIVSSFARMGEKLMPVLTSIADAAATVAPQIISSLINGITGHIDGIVTAASSIVSTLASSLVSALPALGQGAITLMTTLAMDLVENLPKIIDTASQIISSLAEGIADAIPKLVPAATAAISKIVEGLSGNLSKIISSGLDIIIALIDGIIDALPSLIEQMPTIIITIVTTLIDNLPKLIEAGGKLLSAIIEGIVNTIPALVDALPQIWNAITDSAAKALEQIKEIGANLIKGLWEGISGSVTWLKDKVTGWAQDVLDWMMSAFDEHSPSKKTEEMGKNLNAGLANGVIKSTQIAIDAVTDITNRLIGISSAAFSEYVDSLTGQIIMVDSMLSRTDAAQGFADIYASYGLNSYGSVKGGTGGHTQAYWDALGGGVPGMTKEEQYLWNVALAAPEGTADNAQRIKDLQASIASGLGSQLDKDTWAQELSDRLKSQNAIDKGADKEWGWEYTGYLDAVENGYSVVADNLKQLGLADENGYKGYSWDELLDSSASPDASAAMDAAFKMLYGYNISDLRTGTEHQWNGGHLNIMSGDTLAAETSSLIANTTYYENGLDAAHQPIVTYAGSPDGSPVSVIYMPTKGLDSAHQPITTYNGTAEEVKQLINSGTLQHTTLSADSSAGSTVNVTQNITVTSNDSAYEIANESANAIKKAVLSA